MVQAAVGDPDRGRRDGPDGLAEHLEIVGHALRDGAQEGARTDSNRGGR
jgi:hypothetical protein